MRSLDECEDAYIFITNSLGYGTNNTPGDSEAPSGCTCHKFNNLDFWGVECAGCSTKKECNSFRGGHSDLYCYCAQNVPTASPTTGPTSEPTVSPTGAPTLSPTSAPTGGPVSAPTTSIALPTLSQFVSNEDNKMCLEAVNRSVKIMICDEIKESQMWMISHNGYLNNTGTNKCLTGENEVRQSCQAILKKSLKLDMLLFIMIFNRKLL